MSSSDNKSQRFSARIRKWIAAWLVFLAAIFGFGWYKAYENQRYHLAVARWNDAQAEFVKHCKAEVKRIRGQLHLLQGKPDSQKELERQINRDEPLDLREIGGREIVRWDDADIGYGGRLEFKDGVLMGWRFSGPRIGNFALRNSAPSSSLNGPSEQLWRWISMLGFNFWVIAFVAWFALPRHRLLVAQVLLATALASGMAWLVNPAYAITVRGVLSNDLLGFGAIMIGIAVCFLAITIAALTDAAFKRPRFRMRHLLQIVTLVAILLAVGPFGYVTILVGGSGAALFGLVYQLFRLRRPGPTQTGVDVA